MFNLNESNRIVMAQHPTDMRKGMNTLCGQVRMLGLDPSNGDVYIFVGRSRRVMKLLHWEHGGYVMYYKRLEQQSHQFDARQVHRLTKMLLHDWKKFANFVSILGISSFLHRKIGTFSLQSY